MILCDARSSLSRSVSLPTFFKSFDMCGREHLGLQALSPEEAATRTNWSNCSGGLARLYRLSRMRNNRSKLHRSALPRTQRCAFWRVLGSIADVRRGRVRRLSCPAVVGSRIIFDRRPVGLAGSAAARASRILSPHKRLCRAIVNTDSSRLILHRRQKSSRREDSQVGELARSNRAFLAFLGQNHHSRPCRA